MIGDFMFPLGRQSAAADHVYPNTVIGHSVADLHGTDLRETDHGVFGD